MKNKPNEVKTTCPTPMTSGNPATGVARKRSMSLLNILLCSILVLAMLVPFPNVVHDYAYGMFCADGVYIPDPVYTVRSIDQSDEQISHSFRIMNMQPRRLIVSSEPSCGCIHVSWRKASIPPFSWKNIAVSVPRKGLLAVGSEAVAFRTNQRDEPFAFAYVEINQPSK